MVKPAGPHHLASLLGQVDMDRRGGVELVHECAEAVLVDRTNAVWSDADAEQVGSVL